MHVGTISCTPRGCADVPHVMEHGDQLEMRHVSTVQGCEDGHGEELVEQIVLPVICCPAQKQQSTATDGRPAVFFMHEQVVVLDPALAAETPHV